MYFNGPCINCGEFPIYDEGALESSTVSPCSQFAETTCIKYTGLVYACANIAVGMTLDEVINKLATTFQNCTPCQITHQFTQDCEKGWELIFDNDDYIATWYYKDAVSNTYLPIDTNLITTIEKLGANNKLEKYNLLPGLKFIALIGNEFRIELTKSGCTTITIDWQTGDTPCQLLNPCSTTMANMATYVGTNTPILFPMPGYTDISNTYIDWISCNFFKKTKSIVCNYEDVIDAYRTLRDNYFKYLSNRFVFDQTGVYLGSISDPPLPVVQPPLALPGDWIYNGPRAQIDPNSVYNNYPVFIGCGCYYRSNGMPSTHFTVSFLQPVATFSNLSNVVGVLGQYVVVLDEISNCDYYAWDPDSASWKPESAVLAYDPADLTTVISFEDCNGMMRVKKDANIKSLNELILAWDPFAFANFIIPYSFAKRHLTSPMSNREPCDCTCPPAVDPDDLNLRV
jgi:hypothetical protein